MYLPFAFWKSGTAQELAPYFQGIEELVFELSDTTRTVVVVNPRSEQVSITWTLYSSGVSFSAPSPDPLVIPAGQSAILSITRTTVTYGIGSVIGAWTGSPSTTTGTTGTLPIESIGSGPPP